MWLLEEMQLQYFNSQAALWLFFYTQKHSSFVLDLRSEIFFFSLIIL